MRHHTKLRPQHTSPFRRELRRDWKLFKHFQNENHLLVMAFVWLLIAIAIINTIYIIDRHTDQEEQREHNTTPTFSFVGTTLTSQQEVKTPAFNAHVSNVYETDKTDYAFPFDTGQTILIFDISITNNTAASQDFYPANQLFVRDQEGGSYQPHASMYVTRPVAAQTIKPGQTVSGQISFAIPKRLTRPLLYVDLGWNNQTPAVFDVLH